MACKSAYLSLVFLILISTNTIAANIYTDQSELLFKDVLSGGYAETNIQVYSDSDKDIQVIVSVPDFIKNWFEIDTISSYTNKEIPAEFKIKIKAPSNV